MATWSTIILWISGFLFLGTAGYLVANAGAVARLFGKRRQKAEPGDLVVDRHGAKAEISQGAVKTAVVLHILGILGLVVGGLATTRDMVSHDPDADPLPAEMMPIEPVG